MRGSKPRVSKASVYRTLALLTDAKILRQVIYGEKHAHYEHTYDEVYHDHLICRRCGKVVEFASPEIQKLQKQVCRRHRFLPEVYRLQIHGLCSRCRR